MLLGANLSEGSSTDRGVVAGDVATLLPPRPQPPVGFGLTIPSVPVLPPSHSPGTDCIRVSYSVNVSLSVHQSTLVLPPIVTPVYPTPVGGRLRLFANNWVILEDPWVPAVLSAGYRLPLLLSPPLTVTPLLPSYPAEQLLLLQENIDVLLSTNAIVRVDVSSMGSGFYSRIFLVPKNNSSTMRMIHDLKVFNTHYLEPPPHFRMTSLRLLRSWV